MTGHLRKVHTENNDFQHVMVLRDNRKARRKYGEFFVEGVRCIESLLAHQREVTGFYFDAERQLSSWAQQILDASRARKHYALSSALMAKLSEKEETSELVATARMPDDDLSRIPIHAGLHTVLLDRPENPGNLGTSIRSSDAFGVDGVVITGHAADPYHPQAVRGSMGSLFAQRVVRSESHQQLADWSSAIRQQYPDLQIVGTSARGEKLLSELDCRRPTIICAGNETEGLAPRLAEMCDTMVRIPMRGWASSLNVSCALSIMLYHFRGGAIAADTVSSSLDRS